MIDFLLYLLKSTASLAVFYLLFRLLMRGETNFALGRSLLLTLVLASLVIPVIQLPTFLQLPVKIDLVPENIPVVAQQFARPVEQTTVFADETAPAIQPVSVPASDHRDFSLSLIDLLLLVYGAGVVLFILILARHIASVLLIFRRAAFRQMNGYRLYVIEKEMASFAFGHSVVISRSDYEQHGDAILAHEQAHIRLNHFYDLVLVELVRAFHWFNPAIYLLVSDLKAVHEFQADAETLKTGVDSTHYQLLVIQKGVGQQKFALANSFNHCQIKKRIVMMNKLKNTKAGWWKAAAFLPVLAFASVVFSNCGEKNPQSGLFKMENQSYDLNRCIIAIETTRTGIKNELNLLCSEPDQFDLHDTTKVKQLISLSVEPKEKVEINNGTYRYSKLDPAIRPSMTFSGEVSVGSKKMNIEDGSVSFKGDSNRVNVDFKLVVSGGKEIKGSYTGLLEKGQYMSRDKSIDDKTKYNLMIERKNDGYYINGKKSSFEEVVARWKTRGRTYNGFVKFALIPDGRTLLSEQRMKELREFSMIVGEPVLGYNDYDQAPEFPGGNKAITAWIRENRVYPKFAVDNHIQGNARVTFLVNKVGVVEKPKISMGVDSTIDAEALKLVAKMPKWKPATKNGKPVDAYHEVFIDYRLN